MSAGELFPGVRSVLVVLSSTAMMFDLAALRNLISLAYPGTAVFFVSTSGDPVGVASPRSVDLVIDFTPPNARQPFRFAAKLKRNSKFSVGRVTGGFMDGRGAYSRLYDEKHAEKSDPTLPKDYLEHERFVQKKVLELAGISIVQQGGVTEDLSKEIALELPPMQHR